VVDAKPTLTPGAAPNLALPTTVKRSPFRHRSYYRLPPVICRFVPLNGGVYPLGYRSNGRGERRLIRSRFTAVIGSDLDWLLGRSDFSLGVLATSKYGISRCRAELREVLIEYQQLEFEIERRHIVIPWLMPSRR
jgi:hypothetical protein